MGMRKLVSELLHSASAFPLLSEGGGDTSAASPFEGRSVMDARPLEPKLAFCVGALRQYGTRSRDCQRELYVASAGDAGLQQPRGAMQQGKQTNMSRPPSSVLLYVLLTKKSCET